MEDQCKLVLSASLWGQDDGVVSLDDDFLVLVEGVECSHLVGIGLLVLVEGHGLQQKQSYTDDSSGNFRGVHKG